MKKSVGIIVIVLAVTLASYFMIVPKIERDRFNPLFTMGEVYVQIDEEPTVEKGRYYYNLTGYDEDGEKTEIAFTAGKDLKENAFLRITAKGAFVKGWEEVQAEALPEDVNAKFDM
ncbi:YxeA family protein [Radiobacillus sp. PE A8.2]|uniref:YxeA family protein n=1 Tax=Radiobacillus sp. PE A8.2 TaxID=3380349 RepID=UPI0038908472